jgi:hypothetical protein
LGIGKARQIDPEDRAAIAKAQEQGGRHHGRVLEKKIQDAVKSAADEARKHQHDHPDE